MIIQIDKVYPVRTLMWRLAIAMVLPLSYSCMFRTMRPFSQLFTENAPILLFPGLGASRLISVANGANIYPPRMTDYFMQFSTWKRRIMRDKPSLTTFPFGSQVALDLQSVSQSNYAHRALSRTFADINKYDGIMKEPNVYAMPYDFRRIDEEEYLHILFRDIKEYIESFDQPISVVAHSTGGLLFHWFAHNQTPEWRAKWIRAVVNVNVPFGGVVTVLENCIFHDTTLIRLIGTDVFQSLGATVINMPHPRYIPHVLNVDGEWIEDYLEYFGLDDIRTRWMQPHTQAMIASFSRPTGIDTHIVYSSEASNRTVTGFRTDPCTGKYTRIYGDGDGVVSMESLMVPRCWTSSSSSSGEESRITFHPVPGMGHSSLLA